MSHAPVLSKTQKYTTQRHLNKVLHELFPGKNIYENTRRKSNIVSPISGYFLELDFWIPELKLAFEFQDPHHYFSLGYSNATLKDIKERDSIKKLQVTQRGESLVLVPYWWDGETESLAAFIQQHRKDLTFSDLLSSSPFVPIPDEPPEGKFGKSIPDVGEFMLASLLDTNTKFDPTNWWMGEKHEGLRVCWNNRHKKLFSHLGIEIKVPDKFVSLFPSILLDGEIWFGRSNESEAQKLVKWALSENDIGVEWCYLRFVAFDCPDKESNSLFEKSQNEILQMVDVHHPFLITAPFIASKGKRHVANMTREIISGFGKGLVVRSPNSYYTHGRSDLFLKFEGREIKEGLVVGVTPAECELRLADGTIAYVPNPSTEKEKTRITRIKRDKKKKRIKIGDVVTFSEISDGKIEQVHHGMTWHDVMTSSIDNRPLQEPIEMEFFEDSKKRSEHRKPFGHWTKTDGENIKNFLKFFVTKKQFDPLVKENWYSVSTDEIMAEKGGATILKHYGGSVAKLLIDILPDLNLDEGKFARKPHHYWTNKNNRRKFLEELAIEKGLDPLLPSSWYSFPSSLILSKKGGAAFFKHYNKSLISAVLDLFPEIDAKSENFPRIFRNHWNDINNKKNFFSSFASKKGFNPLVPSNWYSVSCNDIISQKYGNMVLKKKKGSVAHTLMEVYPDIGLDLRLFSTVSQRYWNDKSNRRKFFDSLAHSLGFDPLDPHHWYSLDYCDVLNAKSGRSILNLYNFSIVNALMQLYPEIGLEHSKFSTSTKKYWSRRNKQYFLENFAKKANFDPLVAENWFDVPLASFKDNKELSNMVTLCYNGSFVNALLDLFPHIGLVKSRFLL